VDLRSVTEWLLGPAAAENVDQDAKGGGLFVQDGGGRVIREAVEMGAAEPAEERERRGMVAQQGVQGRGADKLKQGQVF